MSVSRVLEDKAHFVGTNVTAFGDEGKASVPGLPWRYSAEFKYRESEAETVSTKDFLHHVEIPKELRRKLHGHGCYYMKFEDTYILYDIDTDTHYFFQDEDLSTPH